MTARPKDRAPGPTPSTRTARSRRSTRGGDLLVSRRRHRRPGRVRGAVVHDPGERPERREAERRLPIGPRHPSAGGSDLACPDANSQPPPRSLAWPEPGGKRFAQSLIRAVSDPRDVSVGPDQHGGGSGDRAEHREFPRAIIASLDQTHPIRPGRDVEGARLGYLPFMPLIGCAERNFRSYEQSLKF